VHVHKLAAERGIELTLLRRGHKHANIAASWSPNNFSRDLADLPSAWKALDGLQFDAVPPRRLDRLHARSD